MTGCGYWAAASVCVLMVSRSILSQGVCPMDGSRDAPNSDRVTGQVSRSRGRAIVYNKRIDRDQLVVSLFSWAAINETEKTER